MTVKELLQNIGINDIGYYNPKNHNQYIIDIEDSNTYGKYFSLLEDSDLEDVDDMSNITSTGEDSKMVYESEEYKITLSGNFESDLYKLIVEEKSER